MNVSPPVPQAAAVPILSDAICLVTSRSGKGWVVPKGRLESGQGAAATALQEAWEEAGLVGWLHDQQLGTYRYEKAGNVYRVSVFLMEVTEVAHDWPDADERERIWSPVEQAHRQVHQPGLRQLLRRLCSSVARAR